MAVKSGYVSIIGLPNVGKSTLMNSLLGQKISITTNKPQTTRKRILGILSEEDYQIIFLDTPGILKPHYLLQEKMLDYIENSIKDADVLVMMVDIVNDSRSEKFLKSEVVKKTSDMNVPKILVLNKIDSYKKKDIQELMDYYKQQNFFDKIIAVSASTGLYVDDLKKMIIESLPEHPKYYPDEYLSDENERFFTSEIVREKIFEMYGDEVPFSCEVVISEFKERTNSKDYIKADIIVEKETQKPIIIGKKGEKIKKLGELARKDIEYFLDREVFLEIQVKVRDGWRQNPNALKRFGYVAE